jgi:hypothetical protein
MLACTDRAEKLACMQSTTASQDRPGRARAVYSSPPAQCPCMSPGPASRQHTQSLCRGHAGLH